MAKKWWSTKRSTSVVLEPNGESYCLYHDTPVVTWTKDYVILDNGTWDSNTTRDRMNQCAREYDLNFGVYRYKKQTYVAVRTKHFPGCSKREVTYELNEGDKQTVRFKRAKRRNYKCGECTMVLLAGAGE